MTIIRQSPKTSYSGTLFAFSRLLVDLPVCRWLTAMNLEHVYFLSFSLQDCRLADGLGFPRLSKHRQVGCRVAGPRAGQVYLKSSYLSEKYSASWAALLRR